MKRTLFTSLLLAGTTLTSLALARDITFDQLPPAVQATATRETQGGTITDIEADEGQGVITYEIEYVLRGTKYELDIAPDGTLLRRQLD